MLPPLLTTIAVLLAAAHAACIPSSAAVSTNPTSTTAVGLDKRQCGGQMLLCNGVWRCCYDSVGCPPNGVCVSGVVADWDGSARPALTDARVASAEHAMVVEAALMRRCCCFGI